MTDAPATPQSDAIAAAQDAVADAILLPEGTPGRLDAIIAAYRDSQAAQANALTGSIAALMRFYDEHLQKLMAHVDGRFERVHHTLKADAARLHERLDIMDEQLQAFVLKTADRAEEQQAVTDQRFATIETRLDKLQQWIISHEGRIAALEEQRDGDGSSQP